LKAIESNPDERWRFLTLTAPKIPDASLLTVLRVFQRAWSLLRKRELWAAVGAGVKGVEFTYNPETQGYHVHIHALVLSEWIPWQRLREDWTACLQTAWAESGLTVTINTESGKAFVDIRLVRPKHSERKDSIGLDDAVNEVCKYITKCESWSQIPDVDLVEIASVERWPRMVEVFGRARGQGCAVTDQASTAAGDARAPEGAATFLDTQCLSDGRKRTKRRDSLLSLPDTMPMLAWERILEGRAARVARYRKSQLANKYPTAVFTLLDGHTFDLQALNQAIEREQQMISASKREWETVYEYNPRWDSVMESRARVDAVRWRHSDSVTSIESYRNERFVI
jgi:hypothetical protein